MTAHNAPLAGKTVAFAMANEGIEQAELTGPWQAVADAGGTPKLISVEAGTVQAFNHLDKADQFDVDLTFEQATPADYDALVLPGGVANPDNLRTHPEAVGFIKEFFESGKTVASICHAPWSLAEAGVLGGKRLTSWPSLQTDLRNAGAEWVDEEVVVDGNLISSRNPGDIPAFNKALIDALS